MLTIKDSGNICTVLVLEWINCNLGCCRTWYKICSADVMKLYCICKSGVGVVCYVCFGGWYLCDGGTILVINMVCGCATYSSVLIVMGWLPAAQLPAHQVLEVLCLVKIISKVFCKLNYKGNHTHLVLKYFTFFDLHTKLLKYYIHITSKKYQYPKKLLHQTQTLETD